MSDDVAIKVEGVSKSFKLPHEKLGSIKSVLVGWLRRKRGYEVQQVLEDVSFEIKKGEFFGIVGRNGSGKSTLLKLISQIYTPDKGHIQVNGKLTPFIELGVGFNPELSGRDNVYLNGALLGFSRKEMESMYDEIVAFAELERFMDQKLKNYSSGMQVRLAFSIAIRANSDILVLDEVLAVGDEAFQRKCYEYFGHLKKTKRTVVLVTHDMNAVQRFCTRAMLIHDGNIKKVGNVSSIANEYSRINLLGTIAAHYRNKDCARPTSMSKEERAARYGVGSVDMSFRTLNTHGNVRKAFSPGERIVTRATIIAKEDLIEPRIGMVIKDASGTTLFATNTLVERVRVQEIKAGYKIEADFILDNIFTDGTYTISGAVASNYDETVYARVEDAHSFVSGGWSMKHAMVHPEHSIAINVVSKKTYP